MPNTIHLIAKKTFTHRRRTITPGDPFTASPIEAAALRYQRKADFAPTQRASPRRVQTRALSAEPPAAAADDPPTLRRHYRRRDMVAEE